MPYRHLFLLIVSFIVADAAAANSVVIELNRFSYVNNETVLLKDIAKTVNADESLKSVLLNAKVMKLKLFGMKAKIDYKILCRQLEAIAQISTVEIINTDNSYVQRLTQQHDVRNDIDIVAQKLRKYYLGSYSNVSVDVLRKHKTIELPLGKVAYKYSFENVQPSKRICIWLDYYVDSKRVKSVPVWFNVEIYDYAYVAKKAVSAGSLISLNDVFEKKIDITKYTQLVVDKKQFEDKRTVMNIPAGHVFSKSDIEKLPDVYKGKVVSVVAQYGAVVIETKAEAQSDGVCGDVVMLKRERNGDLFKGIVQNSSIVLAIGE